MIQRTPPTHFEPSPAKLQAQVASAEAKFEADRTRALRREAAIEGGALMGGLWTVTSDLYDDASDAAYCVEDLVDLALHHDVGFRYEPGNRRVVDESGNVVAVPAR